jgi:hypothetical protein
MVKETRNVYRILVGKHGFSHMNEEEGDWRTSLRLMLWILIVRTQAGCN